ncbi:MAG: methyltransferase domain-containing protein [Acidobacteriia bacterium]|nr:methyltransferase domain-containing protein [Terriglobia bacterium]
MDFTGERIIPEKVETDLLNEHLCRYLFAQMLLDDAVVLDMGSGVGYGSQLLAAKARSVISVDIVEECIRYAVKKYPDENIDYLVADGHSIPLTSQSVDVIVSFELIEHLKDQSPHLLELDRVLKPEGFLVISTPNRIFYTEERKEINPFHTHEFDFQEYVTFLKTTFPCVNVYFQNHIESLFIGNPSLNHGTKTYLQDRRVNLESDSNYFVAICSKKDKYQPQIKNFAFLPTTGNLLREQNRHIDALNSRIQQLDATLLNLQAEYDERTNWSLQLKNQTKELKKIIKNLQSDLKDKTDWTNELAGKMKKTDKTIVKLQSDFEDRTNWANELADQIKEADKTIVNLQSDLKDRTGWANEIAGQMQEADKTIVKLQSDFEDRTNWALRLNNELEDRTNWALRLNNELEECHQRLESIEKSKLYKLAKTLRLIKFD